MATQPLEAPGSSHAASSESDPKSRSELSPSLLTIEDWKDAQITGDGLSRLIDLVDGERRANPTTCAWISLASPAQLKEQWDNLQAIRSVTSNLPLSGVPFAAKDNIDAAGFLTTGACPSFTTKLSPTDATVIAKLKAAGAILIGKTNMDQFATGLVGTRSPHGAVPNAFDSTRVSGGSSSGSAVVVARGVVPFSLGTDTAGSGRIPAGLNNIVGLKPTRGALSTHGVLPACRTLDCVSILALTVDDAEAVLSVAEGYDVEDAYSRVREGVKIGASGSKFGSWKSLDTPSLAICANPEWFGLEDHAPAYDTSLKKARSLGWKLTPVDFTNLFALASLLYDGPWIAERYQAIQGFIENTPKSAMDPVVHAIVSKAKAFSATDAFSSEYLRQELTRKIEVEFESFDGILVPTSPTFPYLDQVAADPVGENSRLGLYTNFVNFLDWSALSIPAGFRDDGLPFGLTLITNTWQELFLLQLARQWDSGSSRLLGATSAVKNSPQMAKEMFDMPGDDGFRLAVVGAHLTGFPLNKDLLSRGAVFEKSTTTSASYRLYCLSNSSGPKKPGLKRVESGDVGRDIALEIWKLPSVSLASFMSTIPPPLGIGSVELLDGTWVAGFVCEPVGLSNAEDVTQYGGWRAYMDHLSQQSKPKGPDQHARDIIQVRQIKRVLVANRGEIAVRIIRSLHKLNMEAVSIYSTADAKALHVRNTDIALHLEGSSVSETYLDGPQILRLAASENVQAIIPGYGFLSENAEFARAVEEAGMIWVGPTPQQMSELGLKHRAGAIASEAGVRIVPGSGRLLTSLEDAREEASRIGFPLMLKSTAGGGGIGLKHCASLESMEAAFDGVRSLAMANFGDGGVFLERFIENARHIEVQILGDGKGRVISAGERDCSLQRRHQKVVEESPAFAVSTKVRGSMIEAAIRLASAVNYRNVGTVEFIYDTDTQEFYFLEVNTRLQVEHPVTEEVTGLDLVECMLRIASGDCSSIFDDVASVPVSGASIEVRLYAESPLQGFRPCAGKIQGWKLASNLRVDTWVEFGTEVSTSYDPLLAKLIATGVDRQDALKQLAQGLAETEIKGVQTNLEYLRQVVQWSLFQSGEYTTRSLDAFEFLSPSVEVLDPGSFTTVQDFPGRTGYWNVGVPPSGPMDHLSFRLANRLVENLEDAAGLECTLQGPSLKFHTDVLVAVVGGRANVSVDDEAKAMNQAFWIRAGQALSIGVVEDGYRVFVGVNGGILVDKVMGSRSTFELGKIGGYSGRKLQRGDILSLQPLQLKDVSNGALLTAPLLPIPPQPNALWTIGVLPGPHGPDFFTLDGLDALFSSEWRVHHNSNRLGVRLTGPKPQWSRQTGGEAGLHPSNIHDSPYSIGSVSFTGDEAVVLTCDGPSLGGFVVFCVVASAEMWKLGQVRPGDHIRFQVISVDAALELETKLYMAIADLRPMPLLSALSDSRDKGVRVTKTNIGADGQRIVASQAGDRALLLEFGDSETFQLRESFQIRAFCEHHDKTPIPEVTELSPGVRTLHVSYAQGLHPESILSRLTNHAKSYPTLERVSSRTVRIPLAFDDSVSRAAIQRYTSTIRVEAPWLPSNVAFLETLNGIDDISQTLRSTTALVLGLGDVFLGSPLAIPLDPRHRLFGTKYNPSRTFTPRGAVGVGGQYICIYAIESPGGYQLVGRTVDIWDASVIPNHDGHGPEGKDKMNPWMFRIFDRITFYPVTEAELDSQPAEKLMQITDGDLNLAEYESWIEANKDDIAAVAAVRALAITSAPFLADLAQPYHPSNTSEHNLQTTTPDSDRTGERVKAMMPGRCYKCKVKESDTVRKGDVLIWIESSKMEVEIRSPVAGVCAKVLVKEGDLIDADDDLVVIKTLIPEQT